MDTLLLAIVGLLAGTTSALCGVGGGIVVVPALLFLRDMDVKTAIGTSLAFIVPTAIVGVLRTPAHRVDLRLAAVLAAGGIVGAPLGAWLVGELPSTWVKRIFALLLAVVAVRLFLETTAPATAPTPSP
jgi:uncharacterized membrane protein YfcA